EGRALESCRGHHFRGSAHTFAHKNGRLLVSWVQFNPRSRVMIPRNLSRYTILLCSLAFVALASAILIRTDALAAHLIQGSTLRAYCSAEIGGNVYIREEESPPAL